LLYLTTQDWPTIYKLSLEDPLARRASGNGQATVYEERCEGCHQSNGAGAAAGPPPLAGIGKRITLDSFRLTVHSGRGEMPAFPDLDDTTVRQLYQYLDNLRSAGPATPATALTTPGPVVASGGAPGGLEIPASGGTRYTPLGGPPYPPGSGTPRDRYYTNWGLYPDQPYVIGPPWSSVVAYDLNSGTIKWKVPFGQDAQAAAQGAHDTGAFMAEHHGIIVTSTGLIFITASDGKVRALDEETGQVLWSATLPAGSQGIPAMYEVAGRQYLVVCASSDVNSGGGHADRGAAPENSRPNLPKGYIAFALPPK
jgi:quinoprotein glucose dehydrogenase